MKKINAGFGEISQFVNRKGKLSTGLIQYPSGIYGIVGSVPFELTEEKPYHLGGMTRASKHWQTKEEAHKALTDLGYTTTDGLNYSKKETN
jgi:hypothetical protein